MSFREVRESDFRQERFLNAKVEDYEFREDGEIVRKDRWEMGMRKIFQITMPDTAEFEIDDIVAKVRQRFEEPLKDE